MRPKLNVDSKQLGRQGRQHDVPGAGSPSPASNIVAVGGHLHPVSELSLFVRWKE